MKTVTGPVHTVENTWETDRDLLSAKENDWGMAPVSHYYYALNALGQRTSVDIDGQGTGGLVVWDWGYDAKGQVVKGDASSGSGGTADDRFYGYDQIGNRKQSRTGTFSSTGGTATEYFADTAATTVGANGLNQYQAIKTGGVTRNPVHDSDGNLTDDGANWDYVWDGENRMISATPKSTSGTRKIIYKYDHLGRLFERELQAWSGSAWAYHESYRYVYDGWNRIESCVNWMGLRDEYVWGLDLSGTPQGGGGVGGMLLWSTTYDYGANWKNYYPAYDGNGNVTELVNGSGTVAAHWEYDPFGNILRSTAAGTWSDPVNLFEFRFSTKPQDRNTGLYYYGYRFFDSAIGRWVSRDPIGERGGTNIYGFIANDGLNRLDLLGLVFPGQPGVPATQGGLNNDGAGSGNAETGTDRMNQLLDKAAEKGSKGDPDCSGEEGCELLTLIIDLGKSVDQRDDKGDKVGHVAVGVGNEFYDAGPGGGPHWAPGYSPRPGSNIGDLNRALEGIPKDQKGSGIIKIEWCGCKGDAQKARDTYTKSWADQASNGDKMYAHCTTVALEALGWTNFFSDFPLGPQELFDDLTKPEPVTLPFTDMAMEDEDWLPKSNCGKGKGTKASVSIVSRP